jgi:rhamnulose-1-phosphate aldolase
MEVIEVKILAAKFMEDFIRCATDGSNCGWHERNGGNLSYRIKKEDIEAIRDELNTNTEWTAIGIIVPKLANEFFLVTGSGKFFKNIELDPAANLSIVELDATGEKYRIVWGMVKGGGPTSELPTHLMSHEVKKIACNDAHRVIYHSHATNVIALTFVLPLDDTVFTRELWEMATECPVVFPQGVGVVPWMIPGGRDIAVATSELMKEYDVAIWAHHGIFCSGADFDLTFGLMHTVEKAAELLVKVIAMGGKRQAINPQEFRNLAKDFNVIIDEKFLYEKNCD